MKLAILFSGQGAQFPGMGLDFIEKEPQLKERLTQFSLTTNLHLESLLADEVKIHNTKFTQPLMVAVEILILDLLREKYGLKADGYLGFSLGEFTALYAAGFYNDFDLLQIIKKRAELMAEMGTRTQGKMAAILSLTDEQVEVICKEVSTPNEVVVAANYNAPGQLVISGEANAVLRAVELAKARGARRASTLNVSGAFHSPYMAYAGSVLKEYASHFKLNDHHSVVYANSNAKPLDKNNVLQEIEVQISSPVYFKQSIENMIADGYTHFLEVGPGQVLANLVKKISADAK